MQLGRSRLGRTYRLPQDGGAEAQRPPPPFGLLALDRPDSPGARAVAFHWGGRRTTAFDATTHRQEVWHSRSAARLAVVSTDLDAWFAAHAEPLPLDALFASRPGCRVHPFRRGAQVNFAGMLAGLQGKRVTGLILQDPYLLQMHQMEALGRFLAAVPWADSGVSVKLVSQLADGDPQKRDQLPPPRQRAELEARGRKVGGATVVVDLRERRFHPLHMRYARFRLTDGERLYVFERGLDIADPRSGTARGDSYVLEFDRVPSEFRLVVDA